MGVEFRCENCGKLLNVEAEPASKIACPYCKAKVMVPAGVASLPRPHVPGGADSAGAPPAPPVEEEYYDEGQAALMGTMAKVMPWVISLFFHAGVLVILAFITIVMFKSTAPAQIEPPDTDYVSEDPDGQLNPGDMNPELQARSLERINQAQWAQRDAKIPLDNLGESKNRVRLYASGGGAAGGASAAFGTITGGSGRGPKGRLYGTGGAAYHIVYLVDRSGSMLETFDEVRHEILRSISRLRAAQTFHVIFFSEGQPKENRPRRLVRATVQYKREAAKYLRTVQPQSTTGQTDPIPALKRAFEVLANSPGKKRGKLIFLLTDGVFFDNEKVEKTIEAMNSAKAVHIYTILHRYKDEEAMKVLRAIAEKNRGKFKFVEAGE